MTSLKDKIEFVKKHWLVHGEEVFEIPLDGWLYQHYWRPLHSYRLWPIDPKKLCEDCRNRAGSLVEDYYASDKTRLKQHARTGCAGLKSEIIQFVLIQLKRRSGKTVGTAGYVAAELFKGVRASIAFISGSEKQTSKLFKEHYRDAVIANPTLKKLSKIRGNTIEVSRTKGRFEFFPTSLAGATGSGYSVIVIDEARNVPADVAVALIHTILEQSGWTCPHHTLQNNHTHTKGDLDAPERKTCTVCRTRLIPWTAKVLIMTSAGELTGGNRDWFFELIESSMETPHPRAYIYVDEATVNRKVAASVETAVQTFLGRAESLRLAVDAESHNIAHKKGEDVITQAEIKQCSDRTLGDIKGVCNEPAVAFLDCATTVEKVSLVVMANDSKHNTEQWEHVYVPYLRYWIPKDCPDHVIDEAAVEREVIDAMKKFPNLRVLYVDVRGLPWAVRLVRRLRAMSPRFSQVIRSWGKKGGESESGWIDLEIRYRRRTIRHPDDKHIYKEAKGLTRRKRGDRWVVDDLNRKKSHKDILEGVAMCCYLVSQEAIKTYRGRRKPIFGTNKLQNLIGSSD